VHRLWHQLTQKLFEFFEHPLARPFRVEVFSRFVRDFEMRLNPLRLVEMGAKVSKDIDSAYFLVHYILVHFVNGTYMQTRRTSSNC